MNKELQFLDWLCGKKVKFPFFQMKDKPEIPDVIMPKIFKKARELDDKYQNLNPKDDIFNQQEDE